MHQASIRAHLWVLPCKTRSGCSVDSTTLRDDFLTRASIGEASLQQHHTLDISVSSGGEVKINVTYKDRVPDLLSRFPEAVRRRAVRWLHWPSSYERKVWRACKGMPRWARETVRQHLLHERATLIDAHLKRLAEKRRVREARRQVSMTTRQRVQEWGPVIATPEAPVAFAPGRPVPERTRQRLASARKTMEPAGREAGPKVITASLTLNGSEQKTRMRRVGGARHGTGSALGAPLRGRLTLTQQLARDHGIAPAWPRESRNVHDHGRGR